MTAWNQAFHYQLLCTLFYLYGGKRNINIQLYLLPSKRLKYLWPIEAEVFLRSSRATLQYFAVVVVVRLQWCSARVCCEREYDDCVFLI